MEEVMGTLNKLVDWFEDLPKFDTPHVEGVRDAYRTPHIGQFVMYRTGDDRHILLAALVTQVIPGEGLMLMVFDDLHHTPYHLPNPVIQGVGATDPQSNCWRWPTIEEYKAMQSLFTVKYQDPPTTIEQLHQRTLDWLQVILRTSRDKLEVSFKFK
jgi:hypothetical protein